MNLVFDFGAVLFTWQPALLLEQRHANWVAQHGGAHALAQAVFHHPDWEAFDRGTSEQSEVVLHTAHRLALPHEDVAKLVASIAPSLTPMPGTVALLERLVTRREEQQDLKLYFLSNMPVPYARTLEDLHDFIDWFDGGVFSGDAGHIKPEPAIYQLMQERYQLDPGRTIFVDDMQANVEAARAQGWQAIHFQSPQQLAHELKRWGL